MTSPRLFITLQIIMGGLFLYPSSAVAAEPLRFNRDIRPILSEHCYQCHGPDNNTREAGLRLDEREQALKPADSGNPAITPGKPNHSELVRRIFSEDEDELMPPPRFQQKAHRCSKATAQTLGR